MCCEESVFCSFQFVLLNVRCRIYTGLLQVFAVLVASPLDTLTRYEMHIQIRISLNIDLVNKESVSRGGCELFATFFWSFSLTKILQYAVECYRLFCTLMISLGRMPTCYFDICIVEIFRYFMDVFKSPSLFV